MTTVKKYNLCHTDTCCPIVEQTDEGVYIGEEGNRVFLKPAEWDKLRQGVLRGEI